eukprot:8440276-Ditylum_brightwellii.AAC.1
MAAGCWGGNCVGAAGGLAAYGLGAGVGCCEGWYCFVCGRLVGFGWGRQVVNLRDGRFGIGRQRFR